MPSIFRRVRTRLPTCLSTGFGAFGASTGGSPPRLGRQLTRDLRLEAAGQTQPSSFNIEEIRPRSWTGRFIGRASGFGGAAVSILNRVRSELLKHEILPPGTDTIPRGWHRALIVLLYALISLLQWQKGRNKMPGRGTSGQR